MKIYKLKKYEWRCPSCGVPHMLTLSKSGDGSLKFIKSGGLVWNDRMEVGELIGEGEKVDCTLCHTEWSIADIIRDVEAQEGEPFGKE